ncbi:MAG: ATP-binding protein, partial [Acidobacteriota bacterium]
ICADESGKVIFWNLAAEKIFGYTEKEMWLEPLTKIIPEKFRKQHLEGISKLKSNAFTPLILGNTVELSALRKDQSEIPIELSLSSWAGTEARCYTGIIRDISERKKNESKITDQQKTVVYLSRMKALGEMAGGIAHEINTPLSIICLTAPSIKDNIKEGKIDLAFSNLDSIEATGFRIAEIVKGLRLFASEPDDKAFRIVKVSDIVEQSLSLCCEKIRNNQIDLSVKNNAIDSEVNCHAGELVQAIIYLLKNAFDAVSGSSNPWIKLEILKLNDFIEISVTDSGNGIPDWLCEKIMQPFFTTKGVGNGQGLGLSITKGIVEKHQGQITIDKTCVNTRFIISLPSTTNTVSPLPIEG